MTLPANVRRAGCGLTQCRVVGCTCLDVLSCRTLIFPFRLRAPKHGSIVVALAGCVFCTVNALIQCIPLTRYHVYPSWWLADARFLFGAVTWAIGLAVNISSDSILINLRAPGETGYISCFSRWRSPRDLPNRGC